MADKNTTIHIVSTSTVRPTSGDHGGAVEFRRRIELTPSDLVPLPYAYIRRGLLFDKPAGPTAGLVDRLKAALSLALDIFFPLAGRLAVIEHGDGDGDGDGGGTASLFVDCNGEGALFVHAAADGVTAADVSSEAVTLSDEIFCSFFPMTRVLSCEAAGSELPLLAAQVTELADGAVFVSCAMNHVAADETSFWHFFNVWSEISRRGDKAVPLRPVFGREYLDGVVDIPLRVPISSVRTRIFPAPALRSRIVHFSKAKIAELKAKANAVSSLQALMAHLWVCVTRSRRLSPESQVNYAVAVGLRPRFRPPLPESYFGNAVGLAVVHTTAGELLERGMGWAAREMSAAIPAPSPGGEARKLLEDSAELVRRGPESLMMIQVPISYIFTGSSPRFGVYGNDFGWGRPLAARTGISTQLDGEATALPGAEEGSVDFTLFLSPETFCALASDSEFAGALGTG